jgi:hypothetical protein
MPADFSRFWAFDAAEGKLVPLSDGPGEQPLPVVLATESGSHAMGIFSPPRAVAGDKAHPAEPTPAGPGYGRFRFADAKVVKWNCVYRYHAPGGLAPGQYSFRHLVPIGDLETVRAALVELHREFAK